MTRVIFKVSFDKPPIATVADCRNYIVDAIATMKGCYRPPGAYGRDDPGDPMFDLDGDSVRAVRLRQTKR